MTWKMILAFILSFSALASDPCEPTVRAQPKFLGCESAELNYAIRIETMMSPLTPECPIEKHVSIDTAYIDIQDPKISTPKNPSIGTMQINPGYFEYSGGQGNGYFYSPAFSLHLDGCSSPMDGGISAGN